MRGDYYLGHRRKPPAYWCEFVSGRCHNHAVLLEKRCPRCGKTQPVDAFGWDRSRNRPRTYCRPCFRKVWREWYYREPNRKKHLAQVAARRRRRIERHRQLIQDVKSRPCTDCGRRFPYYVMDLDHLGDKIAEVSLMAPSYGTESLLQEVAKCEVVCANCHRVRTFERLKRRGTAAMAAGASRGPNQGPLPGLD